jgi:hypothetical protein
MVNDEAVDFGLAKRDRFTALWFQDLGSGMLPDMRVRAVFHILAHLERYIWAGPLSVSLGTRFDTAPRYDDSPGEQARRQAVPWVWHTTQQRWDKSELTNYRRPAAIPPYRVKCRDWLARVAVINTGESSRLLASPTFAPRWRRGGVEWASPNERSPLTTSLVRAGPNARRQFRAGWSSGPAIGRSIASLSFRLFMRHVRCLECEWSRRRAASHHNGLH